MKKWNTLSSESFHKWVFSCFVIFALAAALIVPDRGQALQGLGEILSQPAKIVTNYFALGGFSATFLNMGLSGLLALAVFFLPGAAINSVSVLAWFLVFSFSSWGMNVVNMLPSMVGVLLFCLVKKEKPGVYANAMLLSTGLAPLISELLLRYPGAEVSGFTPAGIALALGVGGIIGFLLPAGLSHSPKVHKGFDHYSAALPMGLAAFLLNAVLYKILGVAVPGAPDSSTLAVASPAICNGFCIAIFGLAILAAWTMGCRPRDYWELLQDSGHSVDFQKKYGNAVYLMNLGVYGLFCLVYFNLIGATFNGATFGMIFSMLAACCCGSHPKNVLPILLGYVAASFVFGWLYLGEGAYPYTISAQAVVIGVCYASGMSPVTGKYGPLAGMGFGVCHYLLVTSVPLLHNGLLLHNGGFTAALICGLLIPQMEKFFPEEKPAKIR